MVEGLNTGMISKVNYSDETPDLASSPVLAPTLFSIFLSAMLDVAFHDVDDGVYIQSRQDADLFNVSHFRTKTKSTQRLVRELLFANDSARVAHTPEQIQHIVDDFYTASKKFGLP